ncbi:MAG: ribosome-associated translation inhibitor RaiA [Nitrospinae bacterium]|nr:ribosome-associated translation inhibitor RaiA [Nitrospinota bacterium]
MELMLTGRKIELTDSLRSFVEDKFEKVENLLDDNVEARLVLSVEKQRHSAEITLTAAGFILHTKEITDDMYASIELLAGKLEKLVKKHKKRTIDKHTRREPRLAPAEEPVEASVQDELPRIVRIQHHNKRPMAEREAAEQLRVSDNTFIMFRNSQSDEINVLYKKFDGNFGLIEP